MMVYPYSDGVYWSTHDGSCKFLENPPNADVSVVAYPQFCNADGSVVVGQIGNYSGGNAARWDHGVYTALASDTTNDCAQSCTPDGSLILGTSGLYGQSPAIVWTSPGSYTELPCIDGDSTAAYPYATNWVNNRIISDDGHIIIGFSWYSWTPVYWTNDVLTPLEPYATINTCSPDGQMIVGTDADSNTCYWLNGVKTILTTYDPAQAYTMDDAYWCTADKSRVYGYSDYGPSMYWSDLSTVTAYGQGVINYVDDPTGWINAISDTNNIAVGYIWINNGRRAAKWHDTKTTLLPIASGWLTSEAYACSSDGSIVTGVASTADGSVAVFWDAANNPHTLQLPDGYDGSAPTNISADGSVIIGVVNPSPVTWAISSNLQTPSGGAIGDFWLDTSWQNFDDPAVRNQFANPDGTWRYFGFWGDGPTGSAPLNWFTVQTGFDLSSFFRQWTSSLTYPVGLTLTIRGIDPYTGQPYPSSLVADYCEAPVVPPGSLALTAMEVVSMHQVVPDDQVTLRWSDDLGFYWSNGILKSAGYAGEYLTSPTWYRLGSSRRRVFEVSWSSSRAMALQGVFVDIALAQT